MKTLFAIACAVALTAVVASAAPLQQPVRPVEYLQTQESTEQPMDYEVLRSYGEAGWLLRAIVAYPQPRADGYRWQYIFTRGDAR